MEDKCYLFYRESRGNPMFTGDSQGTNFPFSIRNFRGRSTSLVSSKSLCFVGRFNRSIKRTIFTL
ncbi:hypothetical protein NQ314_005876 [Rhamnusium bicolor]|uniref:Ycf15 n=1 Tax=Rhamnusium bicolor TaxID=1586634 RepID=A0AAV8ZFF9_9CUCU|nr:hypothetical protein NQ314_005876 [Rhamnusium bicolor]